MTYKTLEERQKAFAEWLNNLDNRKTQALCEFIEFFGFGRHCTVEEAEWFSSNALAYLMVANTDPSLKDRAVNMGASLIGAALECKDNDPGIGGEACKKPEKLTTSLACLKSAVNDIDDIIAQYNGGVLVENTKAKLEELADLFSMLAKEHEAQMKKNNDGN